MCVCVCAYLHMFPEEISVYFFIMCSCNVSILRYVVKGGGEGSEHYSSSFPV